jgi:hypothetical protein
MRRTSFATLLAFSGLACSSTPTVIPTKNLDRPVDMTFVCLGMVPSPIDGTPVLSGQPMSVCHPNDAVDPKVSFSGQRNLGTFAFIANSSRGELAVADIDRGRLLDLSPEAPGYGMLPLGGDPEAVVSSQDGCWVASVNRASCNLTLLDPSRLLASTFSADGVAATPSTAAEAPARRIVVRTASGRTLDTAGGEIAFLPPDATSSVCEKGGRPRAIMTFPSCDLVADVELSFEDASATILSAYYVRPDLPGGYQDAGAEPVCPSDCAAASMPAPSGNDVLDASTGEGPGLGIDGGGADGGASSSYYLQPLALVPDGSRVYVASLLDRAVTSFDVDTAGLGHPSRFDLAESPLGVNRLRLAVDPYREVAVTHADGTVTKVQGVPLRDRGAFFLYAFTRDDSVRVVDISGAAPVECDVNAVTTPDQRAQACIPVGSAPRKPLAVGPGIRIPLSTLISPDSPPPLPRDISFADLKPSGDDINYHALSGQFGFLLASNGRVYTLNLAPKGEDGTSDIPSSSCATNLPVNASHLPAVATNSFREWRDIGQCARTPLAISIAPQRLVPVSDQAFATTANLSANEGPLIESFSTDNGATTQWIDFPDPDSVVSPAWDVVWEGALPRATRASGVVQSGTPDGVAGVLSDSGADFCSSGVRPGDVLMFAGCNQNSDCQPDDLYSCQVAVSGGRGMCLPIQSKSSAAFLDKCSSFLGSRMRYEIVKATHDSLTLGLKLDEVPKTTLNPCKVDKDCRPDTEHGAFATESPDGGADEGFKCLQIRNDEPRCVKQCTQDDDCRPGHVCAKVPGLDYPGTLCVEAPSLSADCFPQPMTAYSVRAGHAFVVSGSSMPSLRTSKTAADGSCVLDATADPTLVNRIPFDAPACPESFLAQAQGAVNPSTGASVAVQNLSAQRGSNPCLFLGTGAGADPVVKAFFQNPQVRFVMTNLNQYAGDLLGIHFALQYGFTPLFTPTNSTYEVLLTMGTRILAGPTKTPESPLLGTGTTTFPYLYVVDQGRTALTPSSRGQVLRINPRAGSTEILTFDSTMSGSTPFQIQ